MALTVGVQTVLDAREVVVIITGAHKALALQRCIEGGVNHMWTLSSLQMHPHPMIVVDEDATLELQVKTVKVRPSTPFSSSRQLTPSVLQEHRARRLRTRHAPEAPQKARLAPRRGYLASPRGPNKRYQVDCAAV